MKKTIFFLLILLSTKPYAQNNDYTVNMNGIGPIKIDMSQADLEKLLQQKIPLTNPWDTISGAWYDSAKIKYKDADIRIEFQREYTVTNTFYMKIIGMQTSSPLCKTKSGIGVGSDKLKIIATYKGSKPMITRETITVRDIPQRRMLVFHMNNNKVVMIEPGTYFSDSE